MNGPVQVKPAETLLESVLKVGGAGVTVKDLQQAEALSKFKPGAIVTLQRDRATQYVVANVHATPYGPQATIRRLVPKLSKAEKKREKRARRQRGPVLL